MKIVQQRDKLLSNFEVYQHLCDVQKENEWGFTIPQTQKRRKNKFNPQLLDLEIITRDLSQYLTKNQQGNDVKTDAFVNLMLFLNSLDLEVIEKLMIVNLLPRSLVNLYAIIEECEDRLSPEQCESILQNIEDFFPSPVEEADEDVDMDVQNAEEVEEEVEEENGNNEEDEEDIEQFVQDDELEHEGLVKKKNDDKEIDETDA